jgi:threonine/homoserine/homoserine lactone efflux protein
MAFFALKVAGACYLLYLAWQAFRASATPIHAKETKKLNMGKLYRRGIIMNVTNPKVSIFFLAFLPQFTDPGRGAITLQIVSLGFLFIMATVFIFGSVALLAGTLGDWLNRSDKVQVIMNRVAGCVFAGLAIKLITTSR